MVICHDSPFVLKSTALPFAHGFFGKGQSPHGMNGSFLAEEAGQVQENRRRAGEYLGVEHTWFPYQTHTSHVLVLPEHRHNLREVSADALVTHRPIGAIGVLTADCGPVLLGDPVHRVIGIAHAGWRGACSGILEKTVDAMIQLGAERASVCAVLGPTIRAHSYEIQEDCRKQIESLSPFDPSSFFPTFWGRLCFDLPGYICKRLESCVGRVFDTGYNTFGSPFFSRRYDGPQTKTAFMSLISLSS